MLNKMRNAPRNYTPAAPLRPTLSAAEQTRLSWARHIENFDAVPAPFKPYFEPFLSIENGFPYTVLSPSYEGFIHRTAEKLIWVFDHEIHVLLRNGDAFEAQVFPLEGISHVEVRAILLDSHIKISGVNNRGVPISTTIRFNTVTDYLIQPILEKIRRVYADGQQANDRTGEDPFDQWMGSSYKFMNYARHSLLGGEKVIHAILQPEIRENVFKALGSIYQRTLSPTHASILTDRELILIREELKQHGKDKYGGVWDYIPLRKIAGLSLREKDGNLLALSIQLTGGENMERLYQTSIEPEIRGFLERFQERSIG